MNEEITLKKNQKVTFMHHLKYTTGTVLEVRMNIVTIITNRNGYARTEDFHISKLV